MSISVSNLHCGFKVRNKTRTLVYDFSFTFNEAGLYVITGPSGCGKSYLLGTLYGTYKPLNGNINFNDRSISGEGYKKYINNIFFLGTDGILLDGLKIRDNIKLFDVDEKYFCNSCFKFISISLLDKYPYELSKGQRKIIELLIALFSSKKIVFLDEALSEIDSDNLQYCLDFLSIYKKEKLIILVSHEKNKTREICDAHLKIQNQLICVSRENSSLKKITTNEMEIKKNNKKKYFFNVLHSEKRFIFNDLLIDLVLSVALGF